MQDHDTDGTLEHAAVDENQDHPKIKLIFGVDDRPPLHIAMFYGLQVSNDLA